VQALWIALIVAGVGAGTFFGFQREYSDSPVFFAILGAPTVAFGVVAILHAKRDGVLGERLRPKWGDFSLAAVGAVALYALAWAFTRLVMAPGSRRHVWLVSLYGQIGGPAQLQSHALSLGVAIALLAAMEELLWRGLVTDLLAERIGTRTAWIAAP
jgi:membrane protease YdiL (CAAX protease family)